MEEIMEEVVMQNNGEWYKFMTISKDMKNFYMVEEVKDSTIICNHLGTNRIVELPKINEYIIVSGKPITDLK